MCAFSWSQTEIGEALAAAKGHVPSQEGSVLYPNAEDGIPATAGRVEIAGKVLVPKVDIGENGFIAFILDTEGNKLGLHSQKAWPALQSERAGCRISALRG